LKFRQVPTWFWAMMSDNLLIFCHGTFWPIEEIHRASCGRCSILRCMRQHPLAKIEQALTIICFWQIKSQRYHMYSSFSDVPFIYFYLRSRRPSFGIKTNPTNLSDFILFNLQDMPFHIKKSKWKSYGSFFFYSPAILGCLSRFEGQFWKKVKK